MRAAHHSDLLEIELTARRVRFVKFGGLNFLESAHVKDSMRMPHHRHARDDKHSFAPSSRFLDNTALSTMDITEATPHRPVTHRIPSQAPPMGGPYTQLVAASAT
jgi:superfamily I DNA/RNA helicase